MVPEPWQRPLRRAPLLGTLATPRAVPQDLGNAGHRQAGSNCAPSQRFRQSCSNKSSLVGDPSNAPPSAVATPHPPSSSIMTPRPLRLRPVIGRGSQPGFLLPTARAPCCPRPVGRSTGLRPNPADPAEARAGGVRQHVGPQLLDRGGGPRTSQPPGQGCAASAVQKVGAVWGAGSSCGRPVFELGTRAAKSEVFRSNKAVCPGQSAETLAQMQILMVQADEWVAGLQPRHA